jgi:short-subunit dehydrogenase
MKALVTGASSGIGETYAHALAAIGYDVVLVARRKKRLEALANDLRLTFGTDPEVFPADLCDEADLKRVEERIATAGPLEFLINNAGFGLHGKFWEMDVAEQEAMHRLHVTVMMRLTHAALRVMVPRNVGAIVNVSSVAAFAPAPGSVSYTATKAWANTFTHSLSLELRAAGSAVRVQALCPGYTYTEFHDVLGMDRGRIPRSWWMSPEDVVAESFRGLGRNKLFVVPGGRYKALVAALRFIPRRLYDSGTLEYARRTGRIPEASVHAVEGEA